MPDKLAKYVETRERKLGTQYVWNPPKYARAGGFKLHVLGYDPDRAKEIADELNREVEIWRNGGEQKVVYTPGTLKHLCVEYMSSRFYKDLSASTQRQYRTLIRSLCNFKLDNGQELGDLMLKRFTPRLVDEIYVKLRGENLERLAWANAHVAVARRVFNIAVRWELLGSNPWNAMGIKSPKPRNQVWSFEDISAFVTKADEMKYPSMGTLALLCYEFAQRPGDMIRLSWDRIKFNAHTDADGTVYSIIHVQQAKTGAHVWCPIAPYLMERLQKHWNDPDDLNTPILICETTKAPYKVDHAGHLARTIMNEAGLDPSLQFRDLRRTGVTEFSSSGATDREIISVSGHTTPALLRTYSVPQVEQSVAAFKKRWEKRK